MRIGPLNAPTLDKSKEATPDHRKVTKIILGLFACSLNFPSLRQSLIEFLSSGTSAWEKAWVILVRSWSNLAGLLVYGGDSLTSYITMLKFWWSGVTRLRGSDLSRDSVGGCDTAACGSVWLLLLPCKVIGFVGAAFNWVMLSVRGSITFSYFRRAIL